MLTFDHQEFEAGP